MKRQRKFIPERKRLLISILKLTIHQNNECKRGYARSGTYVCQQKVEQTQERCPLKAPENYL